MNLSEQVEETATTGCSPTVAPSRAPEAVVLEHVTTPERLGELEAEWNAFLHRCGTDSIFLTWEYLSTWLEAYQADYRLHVLVARDGLGQLVGIAPLVTGWGEGRGRRRLRHLAFIGAIGDSTGEFEDFMILQGREDEVMEVFVAYLFGELENEWDVSYLAMVPECSASLAAWTREVERFGARAVTLNRYLAHYRPLPSDWETYLAERSGHFRSNYRRKWKKLEKEREVRVLKVGEDCEVDAALEALIGLNRARWGEDGQAFLTERFNRFHLNLARRLQSKGWINMSVIEVGGEAAAVCYGFAYDGKFSVLQFGWDPAYARQSIGLLALGVGQKLAMESGLRELDLMSGGDEYKKLWATEERSLVSIEVANPRSLYAMGFQRLRALKNLVLPS